MVQANQPVKIRHSVEGRWRRVCLLSLLLCWSKIAVKNLEGLLWTTSGLEHRMQFTTEESRQKQNNNTSQMSGLYLSKVSSLLRIETFLAVKSSLSSCESFLFLLTI